MSTQLSINAPTTPQRLGATAWASGALVWALGWAALLMLDGHIDLANLAMVLVLSAALASLWLPAAVAAVAGTLAVLAFNWLLVPPRGTFLVDGRQNGVLLVAIWVVNTVVATLMARLRAAARRAQYHQQQAEQLRSLAETLRETTEPLAHAGALQAALATWVGAPAALLLQRHNAGPASPDQPESVMLLGDTDADGLAGLWLCLRQAQAMGPGSGHHGSLARWYLPLRDRDSALGAAVLRLPAAGWVDEEKRSHAQAMCDQMGLALQRMFSEQAARRATEQAQLPAVHNALLAAISHDFRCWPACAWPCATGARGLPLPSRVINRAISTSTWRPTA